MQCATVCLFDADGVSAACTLQSACKSNLQASIYPPKGRVMDGEREGGGRRGQGGQRMRKHGGVSGEVNAIIVIGLVEQSLPVSSSNTFAASSLRNDFLLAMPIKAVAQRAASCASLICPALMAAA